MHDSSTSQKQQQAVLATTVPAPLSHVPPKRNQAKGCTPTVWVQSSALSGGGRLGCSKPRRAAGRDWLWTAPGSLRGLVGRWTSPRRADSLDEICPTEAGALRCGRWLGRFEFARWLHGHARLRESLCVCAPYSSLPLWPALGFEGVSPPGTLCEIYFRSARADGKDNFFSPAQLPKMLRQICAVLHACTGAARRKRLKHHGSKRGNSGSLSAVCGSTW